MLALNFFKLLCWIMCAPGRYVVKLTKYRQETWMYFNFAKQSTIKL